jgi:hypothetical protein
MYGPVVGWWSMVFERIQYAVKRTCKTPKNFEKHIIMQHHKTEYLREYVAQRNKRPTPPPPDASPFSNDFNNETVVLIGKPFFVAASGRRNSLFRHSISVFKKKFPNNHQNLLSDCDLESCVIKSFKKIRCGNCVLSIPNNNKTDDSYIHLKNSSWCSTNSIKYNGGTMPLFSQCIGIYSIEPFKSGVLKNNVYYYFLCSRRTTLGHHRSLWYIDETADGLDSDHAAPIYFDASEIIQVQVVVAQHGELPIGHRSVMRVGRDCIVYAPLTN